MPKPVTLLKKKLNLTRQADAEDDLRGEPTETRINGQRQGAYTLACVPDIIHPYIKNTELPIPPSLHSWRGVIERYGVQAEQGLIDFDYVYKVEVFEHVDEELGGKSLAELGRNMASRISGLCSPVDGYTRTSDGILDAVGRIHRQIDIFSPDPNPYVWQEPEPPARKLILKKHNPTTRLRE